MIKLKTLILSYNNILMNSDNIIDLHAIDSTFRGYAWDYFSLHSDQRMKSFHFYIIIVTAIIGGLAVIVKSTEIRKVHSLFGVALILLSFLFWKLDQRTRQLIKYAEEAIIFLDEKYCLPDVGPSPHPLRIFSRDVQKNKTAKAFPLISGHFSYARVFRWIFLFFSLIGLGITIIFLINYPL